MALSEDHQIETAKYYADSFEMYRKVWGGDNDRMCWGYFDHHHGDIQLAGERHVERMAQTMGLTAESKVLDVGCGKGTTAFYLNKTYGAEITAFDPTAEMIKVANEKKAAMGYDKCTFLVGTLHDLDAQLPDNHFTHIWSNAVFNHIPHEARIETFKILYRKLVPGGKIDFDDSTCRQVEDSDLVRINVKERMHYDRIWSFTEYTDAMAGAGFQLITSEDLTAHMELTYRTTSINAAKHDYPDVSKKHVETANACARGGFGWGIFRGVKPTK